MKKRVMSLLLVLCMVVSLFPGMAAAEGETLEKGESSLIKVTFTCTPEDAKVHVFPKSENEHTEEIKAQEDGSYLLAIGQYIYNVTAENYESITGQELIVSEESGASMKLSPVLIASGDQPGINDDSDESGEQIEASLSSVTALPQQESIVQDYASFAAAATIAEDNTNGSDFRITAGQPVTLTAVYQDRDGNTLRESGEVIFGDDGTDIFPEFDGYCSIGRYFPDGSMLMNGVYRAVNPDTDEVTYWESWGEGPTGAFYTDHQITENKTIIYKYSRPNALPLAQYIDVNGVTLMNAQELAFDSKTCSYRIAELDETGVYNKLVAPNIEGFTIEEIRITPETLSLGYFVDSEGRAAIASKKILPPDNKVEALVWSPTLEATDEWSVAEQTFNGASRTGTTAFCQGRPVITYVYSKNTNDESGTSQVGWQLIDNAWYYYNENGSDYPTNNNAQTGWLNWEDNWYYLDPNSTPKGVMVIWWQQISGKQYYFNSNGTMAIGWQYVEKKADAEPYDTGWYYFDEDGSNGNLGSLVGTGIPINDTTFPDPVFRQYVSDNFDNENGVKDGYLSKTEIDAVTEINCPNMRIELLQGVELFQNLITLDCGHNPFTYLDLRSNSKLEVLNCEYTSLHTLDLSYNPELRYVCTMNSTSLSTLHIGKNQKLERLICSEDALTSIDVTDCPKLIELSCGYNAIYSLDVSNNENLLELYCYNDNLSELDISHNTLLKSLMCSGNTLKNLDISKNQSVKDVYLNSTSIEDRGTEIMYRKGDQVLLVDKATSVITDEAVITTGWYKIDGIWYYYVDCIPVTGWFLIDGNWYYFTPTTAPQGAMLVGWQPIDGKWYYFGNDGIMTIGWRYIDADGTHEAGMYYFDEDDSNGNLGALVGNDEEEIKGIAIDETNFPDPVFRQYVADNFDNDDGAKNGYLSEAEINRVTEINCSSKGIVSLKGVEFFTKLRVLQCSGNSLTSLTLTQNTALVELYCNQNTIETLDISNCTSLIILQASSNTLSALDVSNCALLEELRVSGNHLTSLNIEKNSALRFLDCTDNSISQINVLSSEILTNVFGDGPRREVENTVGYETEQGALWVDKTVYVIGDGLPINDTNFPDPVFRAFVAQNFDTNGNGYFSKKEIARVTEIDCHGMNIFDISGVTFFTELLKLDCSDNKISTLGAWNEKIEYIDCSNNCLGLVDIFNNTTLVYFNCSNNPLKSLWCQGKKLTTLNVTNCTELEALYAPYNELTTVDISTCLKLKSLSVASNKFTTIDVSHHILLETLDVSANQLSTLDISKNTVLCHLSCYKTNLTELDITNQPALITAVNNGGSAAIADESIIVYRDESRADLQVDKSVNIIGTKADATGILRQGDGWKITWTIKTYYKEKTKQNDFLLMINLFGNDPSGISLGTFYDKDDSTFPWLTEEYGFKKEDITSVEIIGHEGNSLDIVPNMFNGYTNLKYLTLQYVNLIGGGAFSNCSSLEYVSFKLDSVRSIGEHAFENDVSLETVTFGSNVKTIGSYAFSGCTSLATITFMHNLTDSVNIGENAFILPEMLKTNLFITNLDAYPDNYSDILINSIYAYDWVGSRRLIDVQDPQPNIISSKCYNTFRHTNAEVSGAGFIGIDDFVLDEQLLKIIEKYATKSEYAKLLKKYDFSNNKWEGSCHGIASTIALVYARLLSTSDIAGVLPSTYYSELPLPYTDSEFLNSIQFYQMSQGVNIGGADTRVIANRNTIDNLNNTGFFEDLQLSLKKLVDFSKDNKTGLFTYAYKGEDGNTHGHSIVIDGCVYDSSLGAYLIRLFDENASTNFTYMTVLKDFSGFSFVDGNGNLISNASYVSFDVRDITGMINITTGDRFDSNYKSETQYGEDSVTVSFPADKTFSIHSSDGTYLEYDGYAFSGNMTLYDMETSLNDDGVGGVEYTIKIPSCSSYSVLPASSNMNIDIYDSENIIGIVSDGVETAEMSLVNGTVQLMGTNYSFMISMTTDGYVSSAQHGLATLSGNCTASLSAEKSGNSISVKTDGVLTDTTVTSYVGASKETKTVENGTGQFTATIGSDILLIDIGDQDGYLVKLNPNGGTVTPTSVLTNMDGKVASLPTPTFEHHRFVGWFYDKDGTRAFNPSDIFSSNTELFAKWEDGEPIASDSLSISFSGGIGDIGSVFIDGKAVDIKPADCSDGTQFICEGLSKGAIVKTMTTYGYGSGSGGAYPTGMQVWILEKNSDAGGYNAVRADFFDNLLTYSGTSIRIRGNQGIAVHTTINTSVWNALVGGSYHGYRVEETGLLVSVITNGGTSDPAYGEGGVIKGVSYNRDGSMQAINPDGGTSYYMNTIVFGDDLSKTKWELACRPFARLTAPDGGEVVLYGGTLIRSIRTVAQQIQSYYAGDATVSEFINKILDA